MLWVELFLFCLKIFLFFEHIFIMCYYNQLVISCNTFENFHYMYLTFSWTCDKHRLRDNVETLLKIIFPLLNLTSFNESFYISIAFPYYIPFLTIHKRDSNSFKYETFELLNFKMTSAINHIVLHRYEIIKLL